MTSTTIPTSAGFVDRRTAPGASSPVGLERRQFSNNHSELAPAVRELAMAIDEYKLRHRRRFISYEEIYSVIRELGYHKD
jgi:hypothetical protein